MAQIIKIEFSEFVKNCVHFLIMPELEDEISRRVDDLLKQLMKFSSADTDAQNKLRLFLQEEQDFLGIMLNIANIGQEKFLRILSADRFNNQDYGNEWNIRQVHRKIKNDDAFANKVAALLLEGRSNEMLAKKVANFYLEQLSLSDDWAALLKDENYIARLIRKKLSGEYADKKGKSFEKKINGILDNAGISHEKGQVELVGKEVDHAIPTLSDPTVMIMSSYFETTSSSQTTRANEQRKIYSVIKDRNERYPNKPPLIFINIVDGGGWLARRSDLQKLHKSCDYCLNMNMLAELPLIIKQHWRR